MNTAELVQRIEELQALQKTVSPASVAWQDCSNLLAPLFKEMAYRQANNNGERDWRKWTA